MFDTPDSPLMDVVDFDLIRPLDSLIPQDENLFLGATHAWRQSRQRLFELLRDAPPTRSTGEPDLREQLDQQWLAYWNARAPGTPHSRQAEAARQYRLHFQAASDCACAMGQLSNAQRQALHGLLDTERSEHTRIPHGRLASGSQQSLPGALVILHDASRLLYLPSHTPVLQAFASQDALEQYLLQRQDLLPGSVAIDYEAAPLDSAGKRLLNALRTRRLDAPDGFDDWRRRTPLLAEAPTMEMTEDPVTASDSFGNLYHDLPFSTRLNKVRQQLAAFDAVADGAQLPEALLSAFDALDAAQAESLAAASALLAPEVPDRTSSHYQTLQQARIDGLRAEADIQQALQLLDAPQRALLDAVLQAPVASQRHDPVSVASLYLDDDTARHELDGVLLIGTSDSTGAIVDDQPVLLCWPGIGGGLQGFASRQALEREFFKAPPGDSSLRLLPLAEDALAHSLARQLSKYEADLRQVQAEAAPERLDTELQALRQETRERLQVPRHAARDLARQQWLARQHGVQLAQQAPDWLAHLDETTRRRMRQLIEGYLEGVRRSRSYLAGTLPKRSDFARQQVARRVRQAFALERDVQLHLELPDSVRAGREPIAGSGAPGTPVKRVLIPSAARSRMSLEDLALQQLDDTLEQRLQFMQVLVSGGDSADHPRVRAGVTLAWLRGMLTELNLAGLYEQRIIDAFMGLAGETPFAAEYREECLLAPLRLMLRIQNEAALRQKRIDERGRAIFEIAIDAGSHEQYRTHGFDIRLLPLLLTTGGDDTGGHSAGLSGVTLVHEATLGITLLYLPDSPNGHFLRQYDSLESARKAVFRLCFDARMAEYLGGRTLDGDVAAHISRLNEACIRQFDGIIGVGLAWPASTSLARHLCDAHKGRLIVAHRSSSRSAHDLFMERSALESGMVFNYIQMALGMIPFVGTGIALFDGWQAGNRLVDAVQRGEPDEALEQLESVMMCLIDALMDLLPGAGINPVALQRTVRQRQLRRLAGQPSIAAGRRSAVDRFRGYEHPEPLYLGHATPATEGRYRNIHRLEQGDFILNHGRLYPVTFDEARHTWRLLGKGYRQPIALDEAGNWDTHGAIYGVNIVSPVSGGGGVLGTLADSLDPLWPAAIRERLPRWWTDQALRRLRALRSSTDYRLRELDRLNRQTADEQRLFNRMSNESQRLHQAEKLAGHFAYERQLAEQIYPDLEELAQLSTGNNRTRARDLMSRVAWLQVNRLTNELNGVKRSANDILDQVEELVTQTASTPPTEITRHLQIMKRRKVVRVQLIGKLQAVANYTHAIELWARRITNATQKSKVSDDIKFAVSHFNQATCDILKVRNYLEVINRYDTATDQSWFYLQIPVARARTEVDRNLNNLFHLPEVHSNAEQRKRMLEACIDSFDRYSHNLRAWATSYSHCFDHEFVEPLLGHLETISELAERWKQKIPERSPKPANDNRRGPSVARKLFETEDNQFFIGIEEDAGGPQRRFVINRLNNGTEVYVPGKQGLWRLANREATPPPASPVEINRVLEEARQRLDKLPAYQDKVESYARQDMLPRNLEHLLLSEAGELRTRAERIAERNPQAELVVTLRRQADELVESGRALRIRQSLASKTPSEGMLDYLIEQKVVEVRKVGGLTQLPKRIEGHPDFLQEFEVRALTQGTPYTLWWVHFHFQTPTPVFERFVKGHIKLADKRRLGLQWQLAQAEGVERIWRGDIGRPMAKKHFAALFKPSSTQ